MKTLSAMSIATVATLLVGCGGGSGDAPKVDAPKVDAPKVDAPKVDTPIKSTESNANDPLFSSSYIALPDIYSKGTTLCGGDASKINWRMRTANLTKHTDGKKDIIVMMWCSAALGATTQAATPGGVLAFVQNNSGAFSDNTQYIFGTDMVAIDGAVGASESVDLNNDGYDEVVLLVTGEDGRNLASPDININGKYQVALTSNGNGQYSVVAAGIKTFGDTIKIVQNGTNKDVLISGIFGGSDEALSLAGNNWTNSNYYNGTSLSGSFFSTGDPNNSINSAIYGDWTNSVRLKKKDSLGWSQIDIWAPTSQGKISYTGWNGSLGSMDYYKINGNDVTFLAFNINCQIKDAGQTVPSTLFMSNANIIVGGYTGQKLTEGTKDFTPSMMFFSFGVSADKLIVNTPTIRNPLANQMTSNFMTCNPLRGGAEQDIFVAAQGPDPKPIVYIKENATSYASVNQSKFPSANSSGTYFTMLYEDVDGDKIPDLIYYPIYKDRQAQDPAKVHKGLRFISKYDLN